MEASAAHAAADARPALIADRIFESLKRDIIEFRLTPDEIVAERPLAARYGVSKAPIREALKRLETAGLVRAVPRAGYIVSSVNLYDLDEIFDLRRVLEPLATRLATLRASADELERLDELAHLPIALNSDGSSPKGPELARANTAFHRSVAALSGSHRLEAVVGGLVDELERVVHLLAYEPELIGTVIDEHSALVAVMRTRDADQAARLMQEQLEDDHGALRAVAVASGSVRLAHLGTSVS
jgi:DNA-binding GntR family transcriptional regulator